MHFHKAAIFIGIIVFLMGLVMTPVQAEYVAYSVTEDGAEHPLPESLAEVPDDKLIKIRWGEFRGQRVRIGVVAVTNESSLDKTRRSTPEGEYTRERMKQAVPVQEIEALLTDVLHHTGRFRVVERKELEEALVEQDLGQAGIVSKESAAKVGKVVGADYLIKAAVTHYAPDYEGSDFGIGGLAGDNPILGGVGVSSKKSLVGMNFRIIDSTTSEVISTAQVKAVMSESGFSLLGGGGDGDLALGGAYSSFSKTPIGQAVIGAINKGSYEIVKEFGARPAKGSVIRASGDRIFVNLTSDALESGDILVAKKKGEELVDPETGISLGAVETELGKLKVVQSTKKFTIAKPVNELEEELSRSDVVEATEAPEMNFAEKWHEN